MENKYKIDQMEKDISKVLLEFRNNNKENRDIDQKILIDRKYENFITNTAKKYELKGVDEIDFPINHELYKLAYSYFEKDKLMAFSLLFVLYTKLRRGKFYDKTNVLLSSNLYSELKNCEELKNSDLFKHLSLMASSHFDLSMDLVLEAEELYNLNKEHNGIANHFVSLVADYYSLHLDDTIEGIKIRKRKRFKKKENEDKEIDILFDNNSTNNKESPFIFRKILLDAEKTANDIVKKEPYEKFYFNFGRIQMLVGKFEDAEKNINMAISRISNDEERKLRVASYNDYLRDIVSIKAYYNTRLELIKNRLLEEDISNEKIINIGYISIFSAVVSFIAATVTSFSEINDYKSIALTITLMVLAYTCIISIIMFFMLTVSKKNIKTHWISYLISILIFAGSLAGFLSILLLNI